MKPVFVRNDRPRVTRQHRFQLKSLQFKNLKAKLAMTRSKKTIRHSGQRKGGGNRN